MSEQPIPVTDTEREALRESIERVYRRHDGHPLVYVNRVEWIEALIKSGVLAERDRRVRAAALAPIQALAKQWQENARANERAGHFPWAMWQERANDLFAVLAAAGVDAAPDEPKCAHGIALSDLCQHAEQIANGPAVHGYLYGTGAPPVVDAAPNETTTGCTCANVHPAGTAHEDPDARSGAAVPSGHEQEGDHRG